MSQNVNLKQVEAVMDAFTNKYSSVSDAKHAKSILYYVNSLKSVDYISGKRFQAIIGYIRKNDLMFPKYILSSVHTGYWLSDKPEEQNDFIQQELTRMGNQFANLELLHARLKKKDSSLSQATLF